MPPKISQLVKMLLDAGFTYVGGRGKDSHRRFYHEGLSPVTICRHDGDDAPPYLVKQVKTAVNAAKGAGE